MRTFQTASLASISCALFAGAAMGVSSASVSAADIFVIRCSGYKSQSVNTTKPFDIFLDPSRGVGWWQTSYGTVNEEKPAKLTVSPTEYYLEAEYKFASGDNAKEWIYIDRNEATIHQAARIARAQPTEEIRIGGVCRKLEPKI